MGATLAANDNRGPVRTTMADAWEEASARLAYARDLVRGAAPRPPGADLEGLVGVAGLEGLRGEAALDRPFRLALHRAAADGLVPEWVDPLGRGAARTLAEAARALAEDVMMDAITEELARLGPFDMRFRDRSAVRGLAATDATPAHEVADSVAVVGVCLFEPRDGGAGEAVTLTSPTWRTLARLAGATSETSDRTLDAFVGVGVDTQLSGRFGLPYHYVALSG